MVNLFFIIWIWYKSFRNYSMHRFIIFYTFYATTYKIIPIFL